MKKLLSITAFIILACCASSSCIGGGAIIVPEVEEAKKRAVSDVAGAFDNEMCRAKEELDSCKKDALDAIVAKQKALNAKLSTDLLEYTSKVDSITNVVEQRLSKVHDEVSSQIKDEVETFQKDIDDIYFNINVNRAIAITSLVLIVLLLIVVLRFRPSEKRVNGIIEDSLMPGDYKQAFDAYGRVAEIIDNKLNVAGKSSQNAEQIFNSQMTAWLNNKRNQATIINVVNCSQPNAVNNVASGVNNVLNNTPAYQTPNSGYAQSQSQPIVEYALYARENLLNVSKSYEVGKSIFKLILASENSTTANIVLCSEESSRIVEIADYLNDYCIFEKLSSSPSVVSVTTPGKAELRNGQWTLIEKVKVELR